MLHEASEEGQHEVKCVWNHTVWAHITQHTKGAMTKQVVAMVIRNYSIPELQGHGNVIFLKLTLRNAIDSLKKKKQVSQHGHMFSFQF